VQNGSLKFAGMGGGPGKMGASSPPISNQSSQSSKSLKNQVHLYFGSSGGTAEQFSHNLKATLLSKGNLVIASQDYFQHTLGIPSRVINLEDFVASELQSCVAAIFLVATYGEGEPTENAEKFAEWALNKDGEKPSDYLANLRFAVFGLGNSTYQFFNQMGKRTHSSLENLGGTPLHPLAEGDASEDIDADFENWRERIVPTIQEIHAQRSASSK
jgi:NADPH-ferrihemoprotein reductase